MSTSDFGFNLAFPARNGNESKREKGIVEVRIDTVDGLDGGQELRISIDGKASAILNADRVRVLAILLEEMT